MSSLYCGVSNPLGKSQKWRHIRQECSRSDGSSIPFNQNVIRYGRYKQRCKIAFNSSPSENQQGDKETEQTSDGSRNNSITRTAGDRAPGDVVFDKYRIVRKLGDGSSGTTYAATEVSSGNSVAIKELIMSRMAGWKAYELFQREAKTLKALSHPNIPNYREYREEGGCYFLVQELADGRSLQEVVTSGTRLDESDVQRIARELLKVVEYLASRRPPVVHRDIKPANIVLEGSPSSGRVLLVDFGGVQEAFSNCDAGAMQSTIVGTAGYMPIEQFRGAATVASDLYAVGGVLLFLLSGRNPSQFETERLRLAFEREVEVGPELRTLLRSLLDPVAEDRVTCSQALDILDGKAVSLPSEVRARAEAGASSSGRMPGSYYRDGGRGQSWNGEDTGFARQARPWRSVPDEKPAGSRVIVSQSPSSLLIEIPPKGLSGQSAQSGATAVMWNVFVGVWTAGALAGGGGLFALFSLPFWFAGAQLLSGVALDVLLRDAVLIDAARFSVTRELAYVDEKTLVAKFVRREGGVKSVEGDTADLCGASVVTTVVQASGNPQTAVNLSAGSATYQLAETVSLEEQEYIAAQINRHLEQMGGSVSVENDLVSGASAQVAAKGRFGYRDRFNRGSHFDTWDDD